MKKILIGSGVALILMLSTGCSPRGIAQSQVNQSMIVKSGVVSAIKQVEINNNGVGNGIGMVLGTATGGVLGNRVGGGTGKVLATAVGAVAGGVVGGMVGDNMDARYGVEVVVKLENGASVGTVLRSNGALSQLSVGQAVNVMYSGGKIVNISPR